MRSVGTTGSHSLCISGLPAVRDWHLRSRGPPQWAHFSDASLQKRLESPDGTEVISGTPSVAHLALSRLHRDRRRCAYFGSSGTRRCPVRIDLEDVPMTTPVHGHPSPSVYHLRSLATTCSAVWFSHLEDIIRVWLAPDRTSGPGIFRRQQPGFRPRCRLGVVLGRGPVSVSTALRIAPPTSGRRSVPELSVSRLPLPSSFLFAFYFRHVIRAGLLEAKGELADRRQLSDNGLFNFSAYILGPRARPRLHGEFSDSRRQSSCGELVWRVDEVFEVPAAESSRTGSLVISFPTRTRTDGQFHFRLARQRSLPPPAVNTPTSDSLAAAAATSAGPTSTTILWCRRRSYRRHIIRGAVRTFFGWENFAFSEFSGRTEDRWCCRRLLRQPFHPVPVFVAPIVGTLSSVLDTAVNVPLVARLDAIFSLRHHRKPFQCLGASETRGHRVTAKVSFYAFRARTDYVSRPYATSDLGLVSRGFRLSVNFPDFLKPRDPRSGSRLRCRFNALQGADRLMCRAPGCDFRSGTSWSRGFRLSVNFPDFKAARPEVTGSRLGVVLMPFRARPTDVSRSGCDVGSGTSWSRGFRLCRQFSRFLKPATGVPKLIHHCMCHRSRSELCPGNTSALTSDLVFLVSPLTRSRRREHAMSQSTTLKGANRMTVARRARRRDLDPCHAVCFPDFRRTGHGKIPNSAIPHTDALQPGDARSVADRFPELHLREYVSGGLQSGFPAIAGEPGIAEGGKFAGCSVGIAEGLQRLRYDVSPTRGHDFRFAPFFSDREARKSRTSPNDVLRTHTNNGAKPGA
ncbi:hypothetical protein EVAR_90498_1 [Eumeta japonica]|uniref:Uncharacterized protein n=1 Tax=Eumeta variegata TaxID=151549 RepID=A0A4C2A683_EUMVA|nr:hypothetical protein EVAR_90498_1 [Eumeta japonica]